MNEDLERRIVWLGSSFFIISEKKQKQPRNKLEIHNFSFFFHNFFKFENHNFFVFKVMVSSKKIFPIPKTINLPFGWNPLQCKCRLCQFLIVVLWSYDVISWCDLIVLECQYHCVCRCSTSSWIDAMLR